MRFTSIFIAGALAVAARAQSSTVAIDPAQSSIVACIDACDPTDVGCLAKCNPVPNPNEDQVNDTNKCFASCDQGDGTEADTNAYIECTSKCITDNYYEDGEGTPDPNGSGDDDSADPTATDSESGPTETGSEDSNETGSSDEPTESGVSPSESLNENEATGTDSESEPTETDSGATVIFGSVIFGVFAAVLAL